MRQFLIARQQMSLSFMDQNARRRISPAATLPCPFVKLTEHFVHGVNDCLWLI